MAATVTLPGCLITQPVHFDPPANSPPAIYDEQPSTHPLSELIRITSSASMTGDGGSSGDIELSLIVYDPDVDQTLDYEYVIDDGADVHTGTIMPSPSVTDRPHRHFTLPTISLISLVGSSASCHRVHFAVSGHFAATFSPAEPGDMAEATWWIAYEPTGTTLDMGTCP